MPPQDRPSWPRSRSWPEMTAAIDLALAMVERDHGAEVARSVARKMVVYQRRAGGQSQFSALLDLEPKTDRIQKALTYARLNLQKDLSVEALADIAGSVHVSLVARFTKKFAISSQGHRAFALKRRG